MLCRFVALVAVMLAFGIGANPGKAREISIVGDKWAPFNSVPGNDDEGYFLDISRAVFEPREHRVNYIGRPWRRAVRDVEAGTRDALLTRGRMDSVPSKEHAFRYWAMIAGVMDQIRFAGRDTTAEGRKLHVAFSPNKQTATTYAALFFQGVGDLRQTGHLALIHDHYGLKEWK